MMSAAARYLRRFAIAAAALGALAVDASYLVGGERISTYRRVLVPAERPENWPREGKSLLPVEAAEFDDLIRAANGPESTASIVEAEYRARFVDGQLVDTEGWWRIEMQGRRPARLNLGQASVEISHAKWRAGAAEARLGWWPEPKGERFQRGLEVPAAGTLDFTWHVPQRAPSNHSSEHGFDLNFPISASNRLMLELPPALRPVIDGSRVLASPESPLAGGRWILALAPRETHQLRLESSEEGGEIANGALLNESCRYSIRRSGIELEAELNISGSGSTPNSLVVELPAGLRLVDAEWEDSALAWAVEPRGKDGSEQNILKLPRSFQTGLKPVRLRAWGALSLETQVALRLVETEGLFWSAGDIEVAVEDSLEVVSLDANGCLQTSASSDSTGATQQWVLKFAAFEPSAVVQVGLRPRSHAGTIETGASLELGSGEISGRFESRVSVSQGELYEMRAELDAHWTIDAVESVPSDLIGEWYVDKSRESHELRVQFDRAITSGKQFQIVATGRRRANVAKSIRAAELMPLAWRQLQSAAPIVQLRPADQFDLEIDGDWDELTAAELTAAARELLAPVEGGRLARIDGSRNATIRLAAKTVAYDATVEIDAALAGERCGLTYELVCTPRGGGIDHALVFLDRPMEAIQWTDAESAQLFNSAKMPASDPRFGGLPAGGELWRLDFGRTFARPIKIVASVSLEHPGTLRLPLVSLPDAASQQGRLVLRSPGQELPSVDTRNVSPAPLPLEEERSPSAGQPIAARAVYRFQPTRFYDASAAPRIEIEKLPKDLLTRPIVTRFAMESRYSVDGSGVHRAVVDFDSLVDAEVTMQFPAEMVIKSARIGSVPIPVVIENRLVAPLSSITNEPLEVELFSRGQPLMNGGRLESPFPQGDYSILAGEWRVGLPRGYSATDQKPDSELNWRRRLFGPLAREEESLFNPLDPRDWNLLWAQLNAIVTSPAQAATADSAINAAIPGGMETYRFAFGMAPPTHLAVTHWRATAAWALAIFMFSTAGLQFLRIPLRTNVCLALSAATVSLCLPASWAPLATAGTLGFAAAALWRWLQPDSRRHVSVVATAILVVALPSLVAAAPATTIEQVLVPVDADGNAVGTKYFVDTDFLKQLLGQGHSAASGGRWLLVDAKCDGQLADEANNSGNIIADLWRLIVEVDVIQRDVDVTLPLRKQDAKWPANVSVDGIPVPIRWNQGGEGCRIQVTEPGRSRLTFEFSPYTNQVGLDRNVKLRLPEISGLQVVIRGPRRLGSIQSSGCHFSAKTTMAEHSSWIGELVGGQLLDLTWPSQSAGESQLAMHQVSVLQKLELGRTRVSTKLLLRKEGEWEWPETLTIAAESGWQPPGALAQPVLSAPALADGRNLHVLPVAPEDRTSVLLEFQFVRDRRAPWGRVRPPLVYVPSLTVADHWLIVTGDDSELDLEPSQPGRKLGSLPPALASEIESDDAPAPIAVVDVKQASDDWHVTVRPAAAPSTVRERVSFAAGKNRFRINYRAHVVPQGKDQFAWSLAVPEQLTIRALTASSGEEQIPLNWTRADANRINVLFVKPIETAYRLELHGTMPTPRDKALSIPRIERAEGSSGSQIIALYREDDVSAEWQFVNGAPWVESGASLETPFDETTRFVRAYSLDSASASKVRIAFNCDAPRLDGQTLTNVRRMEKGWEANWEARLDVQQGFIDTLRLRIPSNWAGPFEISPSATVEEVRPLADRRSSELIVRLARPAQVGDNIQLGIRSPLVASEGQGIAAPMIRLAAEGRREEFLSLPTLVDGEPLVWTRSGIEPAELPPEFTDAAAATARKGAASYLVTGEAINVTLRPRTTRTNRASIRLAETTSLFDASDPQLNVTRFVVLPEGLGRCEMRIPPDQRLIRASLDGRPAIVRILAPNRLALEFRHPYLPQTLDVVTQQNETSRHAAEQIVLKLPEFIEPDRTIPIDLVLWTVQGTAEFTLQPVDCKRITEMELATLRLDWLASIAQQSSGALLEAPAMDGFSWLVRWARNLQAAAEWAENVGAHAKATSGATRVRQPDSSAANDSHTQSLLWIEQMAELFDLTSDSLLENQPEAAAGVGPGIRVLGANGDAASFVSDGYGNGLSIRLKPATWLVPHSRNFALAAVGLAVLVSIFVARSPQTMARMEQWPEIWALVLGIAAWFWLRPGLVGFVIATAAGVLLARRLHREKKSPRHDSSKLPNSIPEESA